MKSQNKAFIEVAVKVQLQILPEERAMHMERLRPQTLPTPPLSSTSKFNYNEGQLKPNEFKLSSLNLVSFLSEPCTGD